MPNFLNLRENNLNRRSRHAAPVANAENPDPRRQRSRRSLSPRSRSRERNDNRDEREYRTRSRNRDTPQRPVVQTVRRSPTAVDRFDTGSENLSANQPRPETPSWGVILSSIIIHQTTAISPMLDQADVLPGLTSTAPALDTPFINLGLPYFATPNIYPSTPLEATLPREFGNQEESMPQRRLGGRPNLGPGFHSTQGPNYGRPVGSDSSVSSDEDEQIVTERRR